MANQRIVLDLGDNLLGELKIPIGRPPSVKEQNAAVHRVLDDDDPLEEIIRRAIDKREWFEEAAVVLVHVQECESCGARHEFCHGWFTAKLHRSDPHAHQLLKGKPIGKWPLRVQRVNVGTVAVCGDCAESQIIIEEATR